MLDFVKLNTVRDLDLLATEQMAVFDRRDRVEDPDGLERFKSLDRFDGSAHPDEPHSPDSSVEIGQMSRDT